MNVQRNDPCPCGSGLKHKHCCEGRKTSFFGSPWTAGMFIALLLAGVLLAAMALLRDDDGALAGPQGPAPPGKVWSPEHGHWHDAN